MGGRVALRLADEPGVSGRRRDGAVAAAGRAGRAGGRQPGTSQTIGGLSAVALNTTAVTQIFNDVTPDGIMSKKNVPPSPTANQP